MGRKRNLRLPLSRYELGLLICILSREFSSWSKKGQRAIVKAGPEHAAIIKKYKANVKDLLDRMDFKMTKLYQSYHKR